jgi:hypothetical protein
MDDFRSRREHIERFYATRRAKRDAKQVTSCLLVAYIGFALGVTWLLFQF